MEPTFDPRRIRALQALMFILMALFALGSHAVENRSAYPGQLAGSSSRP